MIRPISTTNLLGVILKGLLVFLCSVLAKLHNNFSACTLNNFKIFAALNINGKFSI